MHVLMVFIGHIERYKPTFFLDFSVCLNCCVSSPRSLAVSCMCLSTQLSRSQHHMETFDSFTHNAAVRNQPVGKKNSDRKKSST